MHLPISSAFFILTSLAAVSVSAYPKAPTSDANATNALLRTRQSQCLVQDTWPPGPGSQLQPQAPPAELQTVLSMINKSNLEATVTKLASFGTRHTMSNQTDPTRGIGVARDWIAEQMHGFAANAVEGTTVAVTTPSYIQGLVPGLITAPTNITNILGTIQGATDPNRVYVVSGHYDSRCTDILNFSSDAPGADDDASGGEPSLLSLTPKFPYLYVVISRHCNGTLPHHVNSSTSTSHDGVHGRRRRGTRPLRIEFHSRPDGRGGDARSGNGH